jgi:hypothetical protein
VHKQEHKGKYCKAKFYIRSMHGACLGQERERGKLASVKLGMLSNPTGSEPMRYDAWS